MVEERLKLEPEVQAILECIDENQNFLLSGGAGSGKTYSLTKVIRQVISENPTCKVACMTYTNAAVKEIEERVNHKNLNVTTIHDFLWDNIKHFQKEIKSSLVALANDEAVTKIRTDQQGEIAENYFVDNDITIQYKDQRFDFHKGIVSHDELLVLANYIFGKYPKLCDIVKDRYKFIFIDEYQDTSASVVDIFLNHFKQSNRQNIIGFFGDAMQSIYDDTIGNLDQYKGDALDKVKEIKKAQNRRSPMKVIDLANRLRTDGIIQVPSMDNQAPNMSNGQVKEGTITFLYANNADVDKIEKFLSDNQGWNFEDTEETKELNLTHNLIADKAGFRALMDIYDKDLILDYKIRIKNYIKDKGITTDFSEKTFGDVIEALKADKSGNELRSINPTNSMQAFIDANSELYEKALNYNYTEFAKLFVNKDQLIDDKKQKESDENKKGGQRDKLIKHLYKIQSNISLYTNRQYNEFLRLTDYNNNLVSIEQKRILKDNIESLVNVGDKTIEEVIAEADTKGICLIDDNLNSFKERNEYLYYRVKDIKFSEFQSLYRYLEGKTPFSTQHKTKGDEFNDVLVILDNGNWNKYNFETLFIGGGNTNVIERTRKIFYVCCTRAKERLAVFYNNPTPAVITRAKEWFGEANVISID